MYSRFKRKLIEVKKDYVIVCDNTKCDFKIPYSEEEEKESHKYINVACPKCGENLLTEKDYLQHEKVMAVVKWLNKWFSWITFFYSEKRWAKRKSAYMHVHEGIKVSEDKSDFTN